jgi:hypothetical protein
MDKHVCWTLKRFCSGWISFLSEINLTNKGGIYTFISRKLSFTVYNSVQVKNVLPWSRCVSRISSFWILTTDSVPRWGGMYRISRSFKTRCIDERKMNRLNHQTIGPLVNDTRGEQQGCFFALVPSFVSSVSEPKHRLVLLILCDWMWVWHLPLCLS